jgi:cytochrome c-type biogenesis protein CcmH/NrfG
MAMRYFNWKLAIVLVVASVVFGFSVYALHHWQTTQRARQALPRGLKAFDAKKWDEAAEQLGLYIASNNQDISALVKYGDAQLKRLPRTKGNFQQAIAAYRNVLRFRPSDIDTAKKLVELYVKGGSPDEAKEIATRSLSVQDEPGLRRLLAMALWQLRKFDEAAAELKSVLAKHPDEVLAYEFMGRYVANNKARAGRTAGRGMV